MKVRFTPRARTQLELVVGTMANETGFVTGHEIGKFKIIENVFPVNFTEESIDDIYSKMYSKIGDRLLGVFFNNREPFENDWFIEDVVIKIKYPQTRFFYYEAMDEPRFVPLEDAEL